MISTARADAGAGRAASGLAVDFALYALAAIFAWLTAATSSLAPHRAWGQVAVYGYAVAAAIVVFQSIARRRAATSPLVGTPGRTVLTALTWIATALLPVVLQSVQRAAGRADRAQEEVSVVERGATRLLEHGSPYLANGAIAALPAPERLVGYLPYQPGMVVFGLPRATFGPAWWTDARIWFALATVAALALAILTLRDLALVTADEYRDSDVSPAPRPQDRRVVWLVRGLQAATVLPVCALTLATGGDDLPVLAGCLLGLALFARGRYSAAGIAVGIAAAMKLFAWPVAVVLLAVAVTRGRRAAARYGVGAFGLPLAALLPALLLDPDAVAENVVRFPLGHGLVSSPAQSPFPGKLIAANLPAGRLIIAALLLAVGVTIAVRLLLRPPRTAHAAALTCAYSLLAAILLVPSTRFGYLLYPVAFAAWAPALRPGAIGANARKPVRAGATPGPAG